VQPAAYARTVLIEALARAGVTVTAAPVTPNPTNLLPASRTYPAATKVAELVSHPYSDYVRYIMKVSYNIGADASLMYFGSEPECDDAAGRARPRADGVERSFRHHERRDPL
jgi:D-alanyl-D-alanine carboxypeptidase/D-alanyl-D-alanine-endopeptidase (penicillin-binding protein 4)